MEFPFAFWKKSLTNEHPSISEYSECVERAKRVSEVGDREEFRVPSKYFLASLILTWLVLDWDWWGSALCTWCHDGTFFSNYRLLLLAATGQRAELLGGKSVGRGGSWSEPVSSLYLTKSSCYGHPIISEINAEVEMDRSVCLMISRHPGHLTKQTIKCPLTSQSLPYCCPESLSFLILLTSYHQWDRKLHSSRKICQVRAFEWTLVSVFDCLSLVFS